MYGFIPDVFKLFKTTCKLEDYFKNYVQTKEFQQDSFKRY